MTITASWNDATHEFGGWGGSACEGTVGSSVCVVTMDANKRAGLSFTELAADRCAAPGDADCIRAVYRGAPGDYAQVVDVPAEALLAPDAAGRYRVERGEQYTVVTAAPLPEGWTRFYLERSPREFGEPPPTSFEQLIAPVGTMYTFTVSEDEAAATLVTFDLHAARPFVVPRPDNKPELGDIVVTTRFQAVSCASGIAVPDATTNAELVEDCAHLLALRDTLEGAPALNWSAAKAMTTWRGVTVSGTPQRVTKLELSNSGLTGELTGLLGNLTGLTELRLDGNALTGGIPSRLGQLSALTHLYLSGNALTGCVPATLRTVSHNDITLLTLTDCGAPTDVAGKATGDLVPAGTYEFAASSLQGPLVFDIPPGARIALDYLVIAGPSETGETLLGLWLQDESTESLLCLDLVRAIECDRRMRHGSQSTGEHSADVVFDRIADSLWIDE